MSERRQIVDFTRDFLSLDSADIRSCVGASHDVRNDISSV